MKSYPKIPEFLRPHYMRLKALLDSEKFKEAEKYLNELPVGIYDKIIEKSVQHDPFAALIHRMEKRQKIETPDKKTLYDDTQIF